MTAQPVEPTPSDDSLPLRLVEPHEHTWQLRGIDYDDTGAVREFVCTVCAEVWFD